MTSSLSIAPPRNRRVTRRSLAVSMLVIALLLPSTAPTPVKADDGDLDKSFGAGGKVITDFSGGEDEATAVAIQNDGKIVAVGSTIKPFVATNRDFALARYNADGSLDKSFGTGGKVATDFGNSDIALAVAIQQDGKIISAGKAFKNGHNATDTGNYFAVARHNSDGSIDTSFGSGGKVIGDLGAADALAIQDDGRIVAAGVGLDDSPFPTPAFVVLRYNVDGSLDTSFGGSGRVTTAFFPGGAVGGGGNTVRDVVIQADG
ncbi:MAG TPA: delta-60 repeat domain-containing protein, partial [Blastocatellia bacterium]|nr:delta-60 repeat domain-containing protein [Blastocatellia bacterium]